MGPVAGVSDADAPTWRANSTSTKAPRREVATAFCCEHRRGMNPRVQTPPRRRCCECRCWYPPTPSTANTQMTCGKKCRLRRRRKREARRRDADVRAERELERERQRRHRVCDPQVVPAFSRAGLTVEGAAMIEVIVEKLRHEQRLSRAGLRRQLRRLSLGEPRRSARESET